MDKELKDKWLTALRGGEYRQGLTWLRNNGRYCCLGVLCNVYDPKGWNVEGGYGSSGVSLTTLPLKLREEFGLSEGQVNQLVRLNDGERSNFHQIAQWIEKNL